MCTRKMHEPTPIASQHAQFPRLGYKDLYSRRETEHRSNAQTHCGDCMSQQGRPSVSTSRSVNHIPAESPMAPRPMVWFLVCTVSFPHAEFQNCACCVVSGLHKQEEVGSLEGTCTPRRQFPFSSRCSSVCTASSTPRFSVCAACD